jgi:hypothetical protein
MDLMIFGNSVEQPAGGGLNERVEWFPSAIVVGISLPMDQILNLTGASTAIHDRLHW